MKLAVVVIEEYINITVTHYVENVI